MYLPEYDDGKNGSATISIDALTPKSELTTMESILFLGKVTESASALAGARQGSKYEVSAFRCVRRCSKTCSLQCV